MTSRNSAGYLKILDRIKDLSPSVQKKIQKELLEYIDFLEFKYTPKKSKPVANPELSSEQRKELLRRIEHAKRHPETLVTWKTMISNLEKKVGRKISV
ncbi:MAG: hypothetical protein KBA66_23240 [Leptospiraceae bacterium]|nr:hypothetical protein [Leptospiraceae bacterium]